MVEASLDPVLKGDLGGCFLEELEDCWTKRVCEWEVEGTGKHWESVATLSQQLRTAMVLACCAFFAIDLESHHLLILFQSLLLLPPFQEFL